MMHKCILCALLPAFIGQATSNLAAQSQVERDLVVREVFPPKMNSWESGFLPPLFLTDPTSTYSNAFFSVEGMMGPNGISRTPLRLLSDHGRRSMSGPDARTLIYANSEIDSPQVALLSTPNGLEFVAMSRPFVPDLSVWDVSTGQFLRWLPLPPPPAGQAPLTGFNFFTNAGDINGDGWDDLFFQDWANSTPRKAIAGCIDGLTGDAIWMDYSSGFGTMSRVSMLNPGPPADQNGDGVGDFISGFEIIDFFFQHQHRITAHSGVDGAVLWRRELPTTWLRRVTSGGLDLNGNGSIDLVSVDSPDFVLGQNGNITALDGADGSIIWQRDCTFIQALVPSANRWGLGFPLMLAPNPSGSGVDLILSVGLGYAAGGSGWGFVYLDASTGVVGDFYSPPPNLLPWFPDPVGIPGAPIISAPTGDYDGDGFQEIGVVAPLPAYDTGATTLQPFALAILGQRTLFGPEYPKIGDQVDLTIALPAIPNAPYQVILSPTFAPRGKAWQPQDWPTMMASTGLLQRTLQHPNFQGTLDANGQASISFNLPNNPNYVHQTLYARALILDPNSPGDVRTQTSLLRMVIQP
jgi:outer membrane protein assembly factor BamB